eukprot:CAMPEP_0178389424 /NCGR_PEP_ID=MMETSP0689_2-20121128/10109_1 /TAXON_ID=160604 /ORGANISM="Amphidinium massartii, Strain CS-259" /LENGTH=526 /DNA_ID=CAMNT_0020009873 /DNA_START=91 /DNA_END=1671 /DNA_ORIENTATION=-
MQELIPILLGSIVVLIQTAIDFHDDGWFIWALVCSVVSTIMCIVLLLIDVKANVMKFAAIFLLVWWAAGTACMTVESPFPYTGNGYFGSWMALIFSWLLAVNYFPALKNAEEKLAAGGSQLVALLTLASFVVFAQTLWLIIDDDRDSGEVIWVLICSAVSLLIMVLLHISAVSDKLSSHFALIAVFLFVWWCVGWFIATFDEPYVGTGNGFFGCWVALITSAMLADKAGLSMKKGGETAGLPRTLVKLTIASIIVLIAVVYDSHYDHDFWGVWALICAAVSTIICVVLCVLYGIGKAGQIANAMPFIAIFLLCWWIVGTGTMTFESPFVYTGNGYFGAWLALISAAILCYDSFAKLRDVIGKLGDHGHLMLFLLICSVTLLIQVFEDELDDGDRRRLRSSRRRSNRGGWRGGHGGGDNLILGWIVAITTLLICIIIMFLHAKPDFVKLLMVLLLLLWSVGVGVLTFDAPYKYTGNAYFALWGGFLLSVVGVWTLFPQVASKAGLPAAPKVETVSAPAAKVVGAPGH